MANPFHIKVLKKGVEVWNNWRNDHPDEYVNLEGADFRGADFSGAQFAMCNFNLVNLSGANLSSAMLMKANFCDADLTGANFHKANFHGASLLMANLSGANLTNAKMPEANLSMANLTGADLTQVNLIAAQLTETNFTRANLTGAYLERAILTDTILEQATLTNCQVFGASVWSVTGTPKDQSNLIITPIDEAAAITVDNLQIAQFIYLLLNNANLRDVIDTITSKVILILGRFTETRKKTLDALRKELRTRDFTPIIFDFERPTNQDLTGTVETLARMARFIIADVTDPMSVPHELATTIPFLRNTPVLPICLKGSPVYTMLKDHQRDLPHRVLETHIYENDTSLMAALPEVIAMVNRVTESLRRNIN